MPELHVLRVFTAADGSFGNPLGVFVDGRAVPCDRRQHIAADLGFSETMFVDDPSTGQMQIYTPASQLSFAGHPTVGTAWLLAHLGLGGGVLNPPAGPMLTWRDGDLRWVRARAEWVHPMTVKQLPDAAAVDALAGAPAGEGSYYAWAWEDEAAGRVRSRYFVPLLGIGEDEATGAAAVVLASRVARPITIRQGRGSLLHVRPGSDDTIELGGRAVLDEVRRYRLR